MRLECAGRIVEKHARRAELGELLRLVHELLLAFGAGAVDEARLELPVCGHDRLARLAEVRDVVQRVLEPEDVDSALGCACDEPPRKIAAHGPRADEEAAAKRHSQRCLRP